MTLRKPDLVLFDLDGTLDELKPDAVVEALADLVHLI